MIGPDGKFSECWVLSLLFHSPLSPTSRGSLVTLSCLPLQCYHLNIWGCWYFPQQSIFQLVIHPAQHFAVFTLQYCGGGGFPFPSPGNLPYLGIETRSPALLRFFTMWATREAKSIYILFIFKVYSIKIWLHHEMTLIINIMNVYHLIYIQNERNSRNIFSWNENSEFTLVTMFIYNIQQL